MSNLSNNIEEFLLKILDENNSVQISRNELANYFSVAPSQINYVLRTRFTLERGYVIESKRGGGGYVNLVKVQINNNDYFIHLLNMIAEGELTETKARHLVEKLEEDGIIDNSEGEIIKSAISDKALQTPINIGISIRKNILTEIIKNLMTRNK